MTATLDLLDRLIAFPTVSRDSNLGLIAWAREILDGAGFSVTQIASPCGQKAGLHARIGPDTAGGICLSAHTDVVPTDGQAWTRAPFALSREGDTIFGRGVTDMKGYVASALALAQRVDASQLAAPLSLVLSYDEEVGCVGIRQMLPELRPLIGQPRLVIVGEPTSMQVGLGHKGKAALRVTCTGEAGHSALAPQFVNALHVAAEFVGQTRALQSKLADGPKDRAYDIPYSTVHVGKLSGGRALNIVPDEAVLEMEIRHLPQVPLPTILGDVRQAAKDVAANFPTAATISVEETNSYPGLTTTDDAPCIAAARALAAGTETTKLAYGTEAGYFTQLGLDAVVIGPGDMASDGHKPDESLSLEQLALCDAMMDRVAVALAAGR